MTLGGVLSWVARAGLWLLAGVGVVTVAIVVFLWSLWRSDGSGDSKGVSEMSAAPVIQGASQAQVESAADGGCGCGDGLWCKGPQGGIYCLTAEGKKRYKGK